MFTARVRLNPHNDLGRLAYYHVDNIRSKIISGNDEGIAFDCMSAVIGLAFWVESILNYVGQIKIRDNWRERSSYQTKIRELEVVLGFSYDKKIEPFRTLEVLKKARDEMAHGRPMEFTIEVKSTKEMVHAMSPTWKAAAEPELVTAAFDRVCDFRALLFKKGGIKPGAAFSSAMSGARVA